MEEADRWTKIALRLLVKIIFKDLLCWKEPIKAENVKLEKISKEERFIIVRIVNGIESNAGLIELEEN